MYKMAVVAFVVLGLAAAGQAQESKEKAKEPVKKVPVTTVKPAQAPATKEAAMESAQKPEAAVQKEAVAKGAQPGTKPGEPEMEVKGKAPQHAGAKHEGTG
jgi:hypothetical protein